MLNVNVVEDMEVDDVEESGCVATKQTDPLIDSDNKENKPFSFQTPRGKQVERGGGDLDVSEMNMKLRMSCTPMSSPQIDYNLNQSGKLSYESGDDEFSLCDNEINTTVNMSVHEETFIAYKSVNNSLAVDPDNRSKNDTMVLQDDKSEENKFSSTILDGSDNNESAGEGSSSPFLLRGLKSVMNMFRPSQSPINPDNSVNKSVNSKDIANNSSENHSLSSTQISEKSFDNSGLKEPIAFKDSIVKDLQWNEDTTIIFNLEKLEANEKILLEEKENPNQHEADSIDTTNKSETYYSVLKGENTPLNEKNINVSCDNENQAFQTNDEQGNLKCEQSTVSQSFPQSSESDTQEFVDCQEVSIKEETSNNKGLQKIDQARNDYPQQLDSTMTIEKCLDNNDQMDSPNNITGKEFVLEGDLESVIQELLSGANIEHDPETSQGDIENVIQELLSGAKIEHCQQQTSERNLENVIKELLSGANIEHDPQIKQTSHSGSEITPEKNLDSLDGCKKANTNEPEFGSSILSQKNAFTVPTPEKNVSVLSTDISSQHTVQSYVNAERDSIVSINQKLETDTQEPNEITNLNLTMKKLHITEIDPKKVHLPEENLFKSTNDNSLTEFQKEQHCEKPADTNFTLLPCTATFNELTPVNNTATQPKDKLKNVADNSQSIEQKLANFTQYDHSMDPFLSKPRLAQSYEADCFEPPSKIEPKEKPSPTHEVNVVNKQQKIENGESNTAPQLKDIAKNVFENSQSIEQKIYNFTQYDDTIDPFLSKPKLAQSYEEDCFEPSSKMEPKEKSSPINEVNVNNKQPKIETDKNNTATKLKEIAKNVAVNSQSIEQKHDNITNCDDIIDPFLSKPKLAQSIEADYFEPLSIMEPKEKLSQAHKENVVNKQPKIETEDTISVAQKSEPFHLSNSSTNLSKTEDEDSSLSKPSLAATNNEYCLEKEPPMKIEELSLSNTKIEQSKKTCCSGNLPKIKGEDQNEDTNEPFTSKLKLAESNTAHSFDTYSRAKHDSFLPKQKLAPSIKKDDVENLPEAKDNHLFLSKPCVTQPNQQPPKSQSLTKERKAPQHTDDSIPEEEWGNPSELLLDNELLEQFMNKKMDPNANIAKKSLFLQFDPLYRQSMRGNEIPKLIPSYSNDATVHEKKDENLEEVLETKLVHEKKSENLEEVLETKLDLMEHSYGEHSCSEKIYDQTIIPNTFNSSVTATSPSAEKPIMSVSPALSSTKTKSNKTPNRLPRTSTTYSSPAIAAVDQLISLSFNAPTPPSRKSTMTQMNEELFEKLQELKQLLKQKEDEKTELTEQYEDVLGQLLSKNEEISSLEKVKLGLTKENTELKSNLQQKNNILSTMAKLVREHERTINALIAQREEEKKKFELEKDEEMKKYESSKKQLIYEKNELTSHLNAMEHSFNDLLAKYEKSKALITELNESEKKHREIRQELELNYETFKKQIAKKNRDANQELNQMKKNYETEIVKLKAMNKRHELNLSSLETTLAQKNKENIELTAICDDLLAKVVS